MTAFFYNMFSKYEQDFSTYKPLSTIAKFKYGTMPKKDKLGTGQYHAFSGYQIVGTYPEVMFKNPQLIIVARGVGGCGDIKYTPTNCYLTNLSIAIITERTALDDFLYHYLRLHDTKVMNTGSAQPQITITTLEKFEIPIPSEEELILFSDFVQPFKRQYRNHLDENKRLSKLRDSLLPRLMSGELDVSDIDL
ncbi:Type I restriction modification DNA specificity domain [uncultured Eubacterium sp.]|nr:Type I restriction modification DNA specificity domain [uncultured Eubacterium sp.]